MLLPGLCIPITDRNGRKRDIDRNSELRQICCNVQTHLDTYVCVHSTHTQIKIPHIQTPHTESETNMYRDTYRYIMHT